MILLDPIKLTPDDRGICKCPECGADLTFIKSQPVEIVDGKLNMEDSEPHYLCDSCNSVYRSVVYTDYYQRYERK